MPRYADTGNDDEGFAVERMIPGARGSKPQEEDADFLDAIGNIARDFKKLKQKHQKTLAKAYQQSMKKRQARARRETLPVPRSRYAVKES